MYKHPGKAIVWFGSIAGSGEDAPTMPLAGFKNLRSNWGYSCIFKQDEAGL